MTTRALLPGPIRKPFRFARSVVRFLTGYGVYGLTRSTPVSGYRSMRDLYCLTNGRSNDLVAGLTRMRHPPYALPSRGGVLGDLGDEALRGIASEIRESGFLIFPARLPADLCESLEAFALATPCETIPAAPGAPKPLYYDRRNWIAPRYDFPEQLLLESPAIQRLAADFSLLAVAQAYLGSQPVLDLVAMWWSTAFSPRASSEAAQLFHFDMDRIRFLKFFLYLTDVREENGPHCYIARSHRRKPGPLLKDGRIPDEAIRRHYSDRDIVEITGPRGTILAADTRGFHKGKPPVAGDRLMLQVEFASSLFGTTYNTIHLGRGCSDRLAEAARRFPHTYSRFVFEERAGAKGTTA